MTIGQNIRRMRTERGLTQDDVAEYCGVSRPNVSMWENGTNVPRMGNIEKLARLFGVQKSDIIEERQPVDAKAEQVFYYMMTLGEDGRDFILNAAKFAAKQYPKGGEE